MVSWKLTAKRYFSLTVFSICGNTKIRSFFVNCSLTGKSQVFRHGETYQPVVPVFLHQINYYHHYLQHSALCAVSSSIVTQRPLVEGEVQRADHPPLTVPLKEAARPSVATSFLIPDLANKKGEQETFHTKENFSDLSTPLQHYALCRV